MSDSGCRPILILLAARAQVPRVTPERGERRVERGRVHQNPGSLLLTTAPRSEGAGGLVREICAELHLRGLAGGGDEEILSTLQFSAVSGH